MQEVDVVMRHEHNASYKTLILKQLCQYVAATLNYCQVSSTRSHNKGLEKHFSALRILSGVSYIISALSLNLAAWLEPITPCKTQRVLPAGFYLQEK